MIANYEEQYNLLTTKYEISAREYFGILRLAILYIDGEDLKSSYEITQHKMSAGVWRCALDLLRTLDTFRKDRKQAQKTIDKSNKMR